MNRMASISRRGFRAIALACVGLAALLAVFLAGLPAQTGHAQEEGRPLVVFIQGRRPLDSASISNVGPEGLSKLADIFRSLGAEVIYRNIIEPIPDEASVVVLARPMRAMGTAESAYLWDFLESGGNLLVAFDPESTFILSPSVERGANIRSRIGRGALAELFDADFGIRMYDTFVAEPYVSNASLLRVDTMYSIGMPDNVPNPITEPLRDYNLPLWVWGARHMRVEPFVIGGQALPLIYTDTAFAETDPGIFPTGRTAADVATAPVEMNIGEDFTGRLNMGAIGMDLRTGARLAVLGDSEMLQNGFGLVSSGPTPRYPANRIFAERLAAWLLELPEREWPRLPGGFTWIQLDGERRDWPDRSVATGPDAAGDSAQPAFDLQQVHGFADNRYVYLLLETAAPPEAEVQVTISLDALGEDPVPRLVASASGAVIERPGAPSEVLRDVALGTGSAIELRLPQRLFGENIQVTVCVHSAPGQEPLDCLDQALTVPYTNLQAPFDWALLGRPLATVYTNGGVYVRTAPSTDASIAGTVYNGTSFAVLGRNADASWIQVENGNFRGWMAAFLLTPNHDLTLLPEVVAPGS